MSEPLNIHEAAVLLRVHHNTIRRWIREGVLPATQAVHRGTWRIRREDIEEFLRQPSTPDNGGDES